MAKVTITNTAPGARGVRKPNGELVMLERGETVEDFDISDDERKDAEKTGYFEFGKAAAKRAADKDEGDTGAPGA